MSQPDSDEYAALYRRYLAAVRQIEHLATLREIGLAISASLELPATLETIADVVQGALDVRRLTIYELASEGDALEPMIAKFGDDLIRRERLAEEHAPLRGTPMERALRERTVVLDDAPYRSAAYIPLIAHDEALGVLELQDRRDGLPFGQDDWGLFHEIGAQIAIAIHNAKLYALAVTDGLTKLYVRRYFDLRMAEEFAQAQRYGRVFSVLLFDIDHFKKFNDTHGHQTGDEVLRQFARLIRDQTRATDITCRYGGEEIAVICPETDIEEAAVLANKLCLKVRKQVFIGSQDEELSVTTSIGVAAYREGQESPDAIVQAADECLYEAKRMGRNRVEMADQ